MWESPQGLLVDCMWGMREERNQGGLLGLRFEKWDVIAMSFTRMEET